MNILGISGVEGAVPFKRAHWPHLSEREYRMSQGHGAAAALVMKGRIVAAAAEERFNRCKHSAAFPIQSIRYCLKEAGGLSLDDVDELAHGFDYVPYRNLFVGRPAAAELYDKVYSRDALLELVRRDLPGFPADRVHCVRHHLAHAASAYFTSGWNSCLVVVADGMGEIASASVYHAEDGKLRLLRSISAADSIGILYSLITFHLGFDFNSDEYKIMGLAPYGDARRFQEFFDRAIELRPDGSIRIPMLRLNNIHDDGETHLAARQYLSASLIPPRDSEEPITEDHCCVAAALQASLDRAVIHLCSHFAQTGLRKLAMAGGVALNCTANGRLRRAGYFDDIHIQPAAGDDGTALGAALFRSSVHETVANVRLPPPLLGPAYLPADVDAAIAHAGDRIVVRRFDSFDQTCKRAAADIKAGHVIAWYRGRMEFGPRALGNRSILADPANPAMRDRINAMVKMREGFRPFAPAVTIEQAHHFFDVPSRTAMPYMIFTVNVRDEYRSTLPAVTHVDGSARLQTVSHADNPDFHTLLRSIGLATGREIVLNTSFNVKGQPIVNTPAEAIETFLGTGIDSLFLENNLLTRPPRIISGHH